MALRPGQGGVWVDDNAPADRTRGGGTIDPGTGGAVAPSPYETGVEHVGDSSGHQSDYGRPSTNGEWRSDKGFNHHDGLRIVLRREPHVTDRDVLHVPLRFQVPPIGDFAREWQHDWPRYTTIRKGERSRRGGPALQTYNLSTLLMDRLGQLEASSRITVWPHSPAPQRILRELRAIMGKSHKQEATAFRLAVTQHVMWDSPLINGVFAITRLQATQKPGEIGTEYVEITFEEVHPDEIKRKSAKKGGGDDAKTRWHTLKEDDTLYELAKHYYHRPSLWRAIALANGIKHVRPHSDDDLEKWAHKHHKKKIKIPPRPPNRHDEAVSTGRLVDELHATTTVD